MKKRVCALCAAFVLVCCTIAPAFALDKSWFLQWDKYYANYFDAKYWTFKQINSYGKIYVYPSGGDTIDAYLTNNGELISVFLTGPEGMRYDPSTGTGYNNAWESISTGTIPANTYAWNFSCPVYDLSKDYPNRAIVGYLYPNPNGMGGNFYYAEPYDPNHGGGSGGGDIGGGNNNAPWVGTETVCRIITPRDGFKQQGVKMVTTRVYFCIPYDGKQSSIKYGVKGFNAELSKAKSLDLNVIENGTKIEGILTVEGIVKTWNVTQAIYAEVTDYTGKVWRSADCRVICYEDFIDEDGDGLDDRTGQDRWTGSSGDPADPRPGVSDSNAINFDSMKDLLSSLSAGILGFVGFIKEFFSFIPMPLFVMLGVSITLCTLLRVFGR